MDYLKYLIDAQKSGVAALMSFMMDYHHLENVIACFVEGKDSCYYRSRINNVVNFSKDVLFYPCNGRKEVTFVRNSLHSNLYPNENVKVLFFCDRDYDLDLKYDDIFYTDYYSIENYYSTRKFVENVLINVFNFSKYNPNFHLALKFFDEKYKLFYNEIVKVNAFAYSARINEKKYNLPRVDLSVISFSKINKNKTLENFEMNNLTYQDLVSIFSVDYVTEEEYSNNLSNIDETKIRGKWVLSFIIWYFESIKNELKSGTNGFIQSNTKIISFTDNIMLSMDQYAQTTSDLINYIRSNI